MEKAALRQRILELERKLSEAAQTIKALAGGEIDSLAEDGDSTPLVLRSAQDRLRSNENFLRAIFDGALDAMLVVDDSRRYVDANAAACALLGISKAELLGLRITDVLAGDQASERWRTFIKEGRMRAEFPLLRRDGARRDVDLSAVANVLPGLHLAVFRDVTQRKATVRELRQAEERLRAVVASTPMIVFAFDRLGIYTLYEGKGASDRGVRSEDRVGKSVFYHFGQLIGAEDALHRSLAGENALWEGESHGGAFEVILVPVFDESGAVASVTGVAIDVSLRKNAESELRASESRYRRIVENTSEGVWMYDASGITTFMNPRMVAMLGSSLEDAVGAPIYAFMDDSAREQARGRVERRTRGMAERGDFRLTRRDGTQLWVSIHADPLFDQAGTYEGSLALLTDITESRRADDVRNRLAAIVEGTDDAVVSHGLDGVISSWNRGAERLYGYSSAEAIGRSIATLIPRDREDGGRSFVDRGHAVEHRETQHFRKDGSVVDVDLTVSPIHDLTGATVGFSRIVRDLTDRRRTESTLRRTEEQLRQAQKMEAIGVLAGGVAHDFNNLLSVILSYTELIVSDLKPPDPLFADIMHVHNAGLRATALTRQLLAFSRQQVLHPTVLDLRQIVSGVEKMLVRLLGEDIEVSWLTSPSAGKIHADGGQIEQVIMNLVINARDAMPDGGKLIIETANVALDASYAAEHPGVSAGRYVMLAVTDTGVGMDARTMGRVFEPFFTTKEKSKGTGLGLSTVYGIVQQSGGHVAVESAPGKGTTFKVYLPRTDRALESQAPKLASPLRGTETILLVEDEEQVRVVIRTILLGNGYRVLDAQNGGEAFLVCEQFAERIHLLLTDVVMPRMSGRQLAERLAPLRPDMKVLYVSGYTNDTVVRHGVSDHGVEFLQKPVMPGMLLSRVRQVLDSPEPAPH